MEDLEAYAEDLRRQGYPEHRIHVAVIGKKFLQASVWAWLVIVIGYMVWTMLA